MDPSHFFIVYILSLCKAFCSVQTIITSFTTILVLLALFILGGELIKGFASALLAGVLVGTYSSIFVASSVLVAMRVTKEDLAPVKQEGAEQEEIYEEV